jgi:predicted ATPase
MIGSGQKRYELLRLPAAKRLRAELLLVLSDQAGAEEQLHKAVAVAREQSAKSLELRAATNLARLWRDQGKRAEALDLLSSKASTRRSSRMQRRC